MFMPSYTRIGRILSGETVARKAGVAIGDIVVAVNGLGFRRFPPDFDESELEDITIGMRVTNVVDAYNADAKQLKARTISGKKTGEHYTAMLDKIKEIKKNADSSHALHLTLERYDWDSRVNSWPRFLFARGGNIPDAMKMMQDHESWKASTFPIDLTNPGIQTVLKAKAVSEVSIQHDGHHPTVYINFEKLQSIDNCRASDVSRAFVIFTELLLKKASDPRHPKTCQFIDLTGVSVTGGLRSDVLREIYGVFEPNYPETLHKMIMYPVSKIAVSLIHNGKFHHLFRRQIVSNLVKQFLNSRHPPQVYS